MRVTELAERIGAEIIEAGHPNADITAAYTSDLLSDVIAHAPADSIWITIQAHLNSIAAATVAGAKAILIAHNRPVPEEMAAAARREGIALLRSQEDQYTLSCRVGAALQAL